MEIKHHSIIALSDWVLIKNFHGVAWVLEFKDIHAKTISQGKIKVSAVNIEDKAFEMVGILLEYYTVDNDGLLLLADVRSINDACFVPLKEYRMHMPPPESRESNKYVKDVILDQLLTHIVIDPQSSGFSKSFGKTSHKVIKKRK